MRHLWSQDLVIAAIRERDCNGLPLNSQALLEEDPNLLAAGRRYFKSWPNALAAAGLPRPVRAYGRQRPHGYWTVDRLVEEIQSRAQRGEPLNASAVQRDNNPLIAAATYHFGSWSEALRVAGYDPDAIRRNRHHSPQTVKAEIQELLNRHADLRVNSVRVQNAALLWAARKYFGTWAQAVACTRETANANQPD
ncbi:hypothetical protein [Sulfobacillus harzensis]|uniref:Uncharacterized protein n=1 Tax=Sulfobacillus harzensis TaxID=2729629 RepID=A0A7Y0L7Y6_9FIRM|nr:hypothetical protein [Sulfobacillus harzensis]NMP24880.1 hypothetical protein [Sulfobacillus harzensis]